MSSDVRIAGRVLLVLGLLVPVVGGPGVAADRAAANGQRDYAADFTGLIDEVKVFLTALDEAEIAAQCGNK